MKQSSATVCPTYCTTLIVFGKLLITIIEHCFLGQSTGWRIRSKISTKGKKTFITLKCFDSSCASFLIFLTDLLKKAQKLLGYSLGTMAVMVKQKHNLANHQVHNYKMLLSVKCRNNLF